MASLTEIVNCLFNNRRSYSSISNEDKELYYFIINRYLSKFWPKKALELNTKGMDKSLCLDIWFMFLQNEAYPKDLWHKGKISKFDMKKKDIYNICKNNDIKSDDVFFLKKYYPELIKQLIKENKQMYE